MMPPSCGDFASLALCNQELHNVGHHDSFIKLYEQGCNEKYDEWKEKWLERQHAMRWAMRISNVLQTLDEMVAQMTIIASALYAFHEDPLLQLIIAWAHNQESLNENNLWN